MPWRLQFGGEYGLGLPLRAGDAKPGGGVAELAGAVFRRVVKRRARFLIALDYLDNVVGASDGLGCLVLPGADCEHCGHWRASFEQTLGRETRVEEGVD